MRKLSHEEISQERFTNEQLKSAERFPIYALIDNVRSLYNVGSIFRTSDGARIEKLILTGFTPHPPRREIEKTALGATKTVPWEFFKDPRAAIEAMKKLGVRICVLEQTNRSIPYYSVGKKDFPLCLVVGNEITGVSKDIVAQADCAIDIPMFGMKQSLNVAVAYGIALFELVRIWKQCP
ncbi:MAG: RNA methyltransferase [Ignavibacteriae bacterium]|nr:RNA methyltransferase [Ignavibacteriota bacterium]